MYIYLTAENQQNEMETERMQETGESMVTFGNFNTLLSNMNDLGRVSKGYS